MPRFRLGTRPVTLGYSANVRPARTLEQARAHLRMVTGRVRDLVAPGRPFGACLYLGPAAIREAAGDPLAAHGLAEELDRAGCFLYAINAFPLGDFHAAVVKEGAFHPDWRDPARRALTEQVAALACRLAPEGTEVTVSTLAGGYKPEADDAARAAMAAALVATAQTLHRLEDETGRRIVLALEPEPWTACETAADAIRFFAGPVAAAAEAAEASRAVGTHLGVNLDLCHAAVEFEDAVAAARECARHGIRIGSVHAAAALRVPAPDAEALARLARFVEPRYLHQTVAGHGGLPRARWRDLPDFLADPAAVTPDDEVRVHFHVPLDAAEVGGLPTTAAQTLAAVRAIVEEGLTDKVIAETYTFGAGPLDDPGDLAEALARELRWLIAGLGLVPA